MKLIFAFMLFVHSTIGFSQVEQSLDILRFDEYLGLVKKFHPIVKQAELGIDESQAKLLKIRGAFDPKIEIDYSRKKFKNTPYYDKLNGTFKIPTWFGIELKAAFDENSGEYLNAEQFVPDNGLYSAGLSIPLAQNLLINDRMSALKQAKLYREQAKLDRDILVNNILYEASLAYFNWLQAYNELSLFETILINAQLRFNGVLKGAEVGEIADIDVTEARIAVNNRKLGLEQSKVRLVKAALEISNFLWLENNVPIELQPEIIPDVNSAPKVDATFNINLLSKDMELIDKHPKLIVMDYKMEGLEVQAKLKANKLLPKINLEYNFLSETPNVARTFNVSEYKSGLNVSLPLFLRKERGELKLARLKLKDAAFERDAIRVHLQNKIAALKQELNSYMVQNEISNEMVVDSEQLLRAEERKFELGESSLFLVNSRESKFIDAQLKAIEIQNKILRSKAQLFKSLSVNPNL